MAMFTHVRSANVLLAQGHYLHAAGRFEEALRTGLLGPRVACERNFQLEDMLVAEACRRRGLGRARAGAGAPISAPPPIWQFYVLDGAVASSVASLADTASSSAPLVGTCLLKGAWTEPVPLDAAQIALLLPQTE